MPLTLRRKTLTRAAAVFAVVLSALLVLSAAAIAVEARHDCAGDSCPVCALVRTAAGRFKAFGGASVVTAALCFAALLFALPPFFLFRPAYSFSLISDKVRLND